MGYQQRYTMGRERCCTIRHLLSAFKRSGSAPLDITISHLSVEMASILVDERDRWAQLEWSVWRPKFSTDAMKILFEEPDAKVTLASVHLKSLSHPLVVEWLEAVEPQYLQLSHCFLEPFTYTTLWDNLQHLNINNTENRPGSKASVVAFLQLVREQLVDLDLRNLQFSRTDLLETLEFPKLQHLNLTCVERWWKISAPNIATLKLVPLTSAPSNVFLNYPNLVDFYYDAYETPLSFETICAPRLVSMTLHYPTLGKPGLNFVWCTGSLELSDIVPKRITLQGVSRCGKKFYWKDLVESLRPHRRLEALYIEDIRLPPVFYKWFLKSHAQNGRILCPRLRELVVGMGFSRAQRDIDYYDKIFEQLGAQRKHSAVPIEKLSVEWPSSSKLGTTDYMDDSENDEEEEEEEDSVD
jgi:hypothetical protein